MVEIPRIKRRRWYERDWPSELIKSGPPVLAGVVTVAATLTDSGKPRWHGIVLGVGVLWLVAASVWTVLRARKRDAESERKQGPADLAGGAYVLYELICQAAKERNPDQRTLRLTIHGVDWSDPTSPVLQQAISYVGDTSGGSAGREFSVKSGIIGRVVQLNRPLVGNRISPDYDGLVRELQRDWNYTEKEARALRPDRFCWMGVPIHDASKKPIGVLYLDSSKPRYFETKMIQNLAICGAIGLAQYVRERYG